MAATGVLSVNTSSKAYVTSDATGDDISSKEMRNCDTRPYRRHLYGIIL